MIQQIITSAFHTNILEYFPLLIFLAIFKIVVFLGFYTFPYEFICYLLQFR